MRKKREPESDDHRSERIEEEARQRIEQAAADEQTVDAAVRRSIELYGP